MEAMWLWRQFPRQIASDLARFYPGRRIAEWHQGTMSSYEFLELVEFLPDEGHFQKALRCGEFSANEQVWRHIANELAKLRCGYHAVHGGQQYKPKVFFTLAEIKEMQEEAESAEESREAVYSFADRTDRYAK